MFNLIDQSSLIKYFLVFLLVLALMLVLVRCVKWLEKTSGREKSGPRLRVLEWRRLDHKRKLVVVGWEDALHLLLVGGHQDVVIDIKPDKGVALRAGEGHDVVRDGAGIAVPSAQGDGKTSSEARHAPPENQNTSRYAPPVAKPSHPVSVKTTPIRSVRQVSDGSGSLTGTARDGDFVKRSGRHDGDAALREFEASQRNGVLSDIAFLDDAEPCPLSVNGDAFVPELNASEGSQQPDRLTRPGSVTATHSEDRSGDWKNDEYALDDIREKIAQALEQSVAEDDRSDLVSPLAGGREGIVAENHRSVISDGAGNGEAEQSQTELPHAPAELQHEDASMQRAGGPGIRERLRDSLSASGAGLKEFDLVDFGSSESDFEFREPSATGKSPVGRHAVNESDTSQDADGGASGESTVRKVSRSWVSSPEVRPDEKQTEALTIDGIHEKIAKALERSVDEHCVGGLNPEITNVPHAGGLKSRISEEIVSNSPLVAEVIPADDVSARRTRAARSAPDKQGELSSEFAGTDLAGTPGAISDSRNTQNEVDPRKLASVADKSGFPMGRKSVLDEPLRLSGKLLNQLIAVDHATMDSGCRTRSDSDSKDGRTRLGVRLADVPEVTVFQSLASETRISSMSSKTEPVEPEDREGLRVPRYSGRFDGSDSNASSEVSASFCDSDVTEGEEAIRIPGSFEHSVNVAATEVVEISDRTANENPPERKECDEKPSGEGPGSLTEEFEPFRFSEAFPRASRSRRQA